MRNEGTVGGSTSRRYSPQDKARAVRLVRQLRKELRTSHEPRNLALAAPTGCALLSITGALSERAKSQSVAVDVAATEPPSRMAPEEYWPDSWLPIGENGSGRLLVVDTARGATEAPVRFHDWGGESAEAAPSLVVAAQLWLAVLDTGLYTWVGGAWNYNYVKLPREYRENDLVG